MTFIPDASTLVAYSIACLVLFITPGPDMSLFLARTMAGGRRLGVASALGANVGCVAHTTLAAIGVSALLAASATGFLVLKIVGALYLLWLAIDAIRNGSALNVREGATVNQSFLRTFLMGVGVNLTNPKVVLFFVTFLPQFVDRADPAAPEKLFFLGVEFIVISIPLMVLTVLLAEQLTALPTRSKWVQRALNYSFAAVFTGFALVILGAQARH